MLSKRKKIRILVKRDITLKLLREEVQIVLLLFIKHFRALKGIVRGVTWTVRDLLHVCDLLYKQY